MLQILMNIKTEVFHNNSHYGVSQILNIKKNFFGSLLNGCIWGLIFSSSMAAFWTRCICMILDIFLGDFISMKSYIENFTFLVDSAHRN